ncbi:hypothetical protein A2U01_0073970, partial [Trifolium medium]|nr:hypothetical protein [Trifolium medium]
FFFFDGSVFVVHGGGGLPLADPAVVMLVCRKLRWWLLASGDGGVRCSGSFVALRWM